MPPKRWSTSTLKRGPTSMKSPRKSPGDSQSDIAPKSPKSMKSSGKKEGASPSPSPMKSSRKTEGASPERGQDKQNEKRAESPHKRSSAQRAEKLLPKGKGKGKAKSKSKPKRLPKEKGKGKGKAKSKPSAKACTSNSHPGRVFKGLLRPKSHDTVLKSVMKIQMTKLSSAELERLVANMKSASAESGFKVSSGCSGSNMFFIVFNVRNHAGPVAPRHVRVRAGWNKNNNGLNILPRVKGKTLASSRMSAT